MKKPILIVRIKDPMNSEALKEAETSIERRVKNEYHVLIIWNQNVDNPQFEVHNVSDQTPVDIEELKSIINKANK